jgi:hypothetical protein
MASSLKLELTATAGVTALHVRLHGPQVHGARTAAALAAPVALAVSVNDVEVLDMQMGKSLAISPAFVFYFPKAKTGDVLSAIMSFSHGDPVTASITVP